MPKKPAQSPADSSERPKLTLAPLTMDQAVDAIFHIKPPDVKRIVASRPGKGKAKGGAKRKGK